MSTTWVRIFFWLYLLFLVWADATVTNPADPDLWHRLALGEALCQTGHFPSGDAFSYLADYKHVIDHEWGSGLVFYLCYPWFPSVYVGIKLITLALTLSLLVMAGLYNRRPTMLMAGFYALVLLALLPSFMSTIRCMVFTHIFFALWLYWFQRERHGRPVPTYLYVLIMIPWANLHGGYVIGLGWLFLVGLVEWICSGDWKKWAIRFGACSVSTVINPYGVYLWDFTWRGLAVSRQGFAEWAPVSWWPDPMAYPGYKLILLGLVVGLALRIYHSGWNRIDRPITLLLGFFIVLSLTSARQSAILASVAGALAPGFFPPEPLLEQIYHPIRRLGYMGFCAALLIVPLFCVLRFFPGEGLKLRLDPVSCPVEAVDYLKDNNIRGNLLVPFNYGSYALWQLRGRMRVSMDGRYEIIYRLETYKRVDDFFFARGDWPSLLTTPKPDAILVPVADAVYPKLLAESAWTEAWHNDTDAVFLPR